MNKIFIILPAFLMLCSVAATPGLLNKLVPGIAHTVKDLPSGLGLGGEEKKTKIGLSFVPELRTCLLEKGFDHASIKITLNILLQTLIDVNAVPFDTIGTCVKVPAMDRQYVRIDDLYTVVVSLGCDKILCIVPSAIVEDSLCVNPTVAPLIYRQVFILILAYIDGLRGQCLIQNHGLLTLNLKAIGL